MTIVSSAETAPLGVSAVHLRLLSATRSTNALGPKRNLMLLNVWVGGTSTSGSGFLARGEQSSFARASYPGGSLRGIWGSSDDDLWVAPYDGLLQHWDGSEWREHAVDASDLHLLGLGGTSARDVWAVGLRGAILHWDGETWMQFPQQTERNLWSIWAAAPDDVWAVGGALMHWNGDTWRKVAAL